PVVVTGESFSGTIHVQDLSSVSLLVEATDIPEHVTVDVQRDPVRQIIEHIDLVVVRRGEKVTVDVPRRRHR
ncbi:hypothetical protein, partial [Klebsiella pneumoniae]|uniref:hypothetical protein n=1 Tax=Klebsiella pneumoniae TaxID=573 RepID=UPI001C534580